MTNGIKVIILDIEDAKILLSLIPKEKEHLNQMIEKRNGTYKAYCDFKDNIEFVQDFVENRIWK